MADGADTGDAAAFEPAAFAREFRRFLEAYNRLIPPEQAPIRDMLDEHFGGPTAELPGVAEELEPPEHPNL